LGYNTGDTYEEKIFEICKNKGITKPGSVRAGASSSHADIEFLHLGSVYKLEVKNDQNPDYGQRRLHFNTSTRVWEWAVNDTVTQFYNQLNVLGIIKSQFNPIWYQKMLPNLKRTRWKKDPQGTSYNITDLRYDQTNFENPGNPIPTKALFNYYSKRGTHYIQIEGSGFYHLDQDVANLGTTQYDGVLTMRFRLKRHKSTPIHSCSFFAVLKEQRKPTPSPFNIEINALQSFPNIK
jgi:hypothetical protein